MLRSDSLREPSRVAPASSRVGLVEHPYLILLATCRCVRAVPGQNGLLNEVAASIFDPSRARISPENTMQEELLKLQKEFAQAITNNDAEAVNQFLADDWIIVDPDGGIINKVRFLEVIRSGALSHELMESAD